jgi:sodium/potassium/calcium exchanger 6
MASKVSKYAAGAFGIFLLVPTVVLVLGMSQARYGYKDPCDGGVEADAQALFDYMAYYSCAEALPLVVKVPLLVIWLVLLISLLASTADLFFVPQLDALSRDLQLSEDVAGVTLLALGNGMPDVMTATSAINGAGDFQLTMGEFLGAAMFIITLVLGCVLLSTSGPTCVQAKPFVRDAAAYSIVIVYMVSVTWDGTIYLFEALLFFVLYAAYVAVVVWPTRRRPTQLDLDEDVELANVEPLDPASQAPLPLRNDAVVPQLIESLKESGGSVSTAASLGEAGDTDKPPLEDDLQSPATREFNDDMQFVLLESDVETDTEDEWQGSRGDNQEYDALEGFDAAMDADGIFAVVQVWMELPFTVARHASIPAANWSPKRRRLAALCPTCGLQVMLLSFGGRDAYQVRVAAVPVWLLAVLLGFVAGVALLVASSPHRRPRWHSLLLLFAFALSIGWFNLLATECVAVLEMFGLNFGISSSVLGITVLAWGNSVGDLVADTALARQGRSRTAVAGCFGSPLLSDLLGLGVALTSYTASKGPLQVHLGTKNKCAVLFLCLSMVLTSAAFVWNDFRCPRRFAYVLITLYAVFVVISCFLEVEKVYTQSST